MYFCLIKCSGMKRCLLFSFFALFLLVNSEVKAQNSPTVNSASYDYATDDIKVFPNPTIDYFQITNTPAIKKVVIYNMYGKEVKTINNTSSSTYDVTDIKFGMYIVKMLDDKNKIVKSVKLQKSSVGA